MASIVCSTLLGMIALIGLFWGKDGIKEFSIGIGVTIVVIIFFYITNRIEVE